jgi:hypothetical protein
MSDIPTDLLAFLQDEEARSYDSMLLSEVEAALDSYNCRPYGNEEDGRSQIVAADVSEAIDYMLTSIMDVFAGTDRIVEFEPTNEGDEDLCDDATEAMHYIYRRRSGYRFIHDWAKAGLSEKVGFVKSCVEKRRKRVEGVMDVLNMPEDPKSAGVIEATPVEGAVDEQGNPTHFHVAALQEQPAEFPDYFVPLEEMRVSPDTGCDLDNKVYLGHITPKRISELVEMGFDVDGLNLGEGGNPNFSVLAQARDDGRNTWYGLLDRQGANRQVWLNEEYVLFDLNGDGIAERLCVHRVGNTILMRDGKLAIEEVDYQPFEYWCPYPMQGRLIGQSLADKTMDTQLVNTVLERNMLDGLYHNLKPRPLVHEDSIGDHTMDDILTVYPGAPIRWRGQVAPSYERPPDMSSVALQAIEFKIRQRESRTGITRLNKGVDEDALNDTARGQAQLMTRGQQMERYIIRNFAEGVARLFMKKVGLMRRYAQPFQIRVDGQFRQVDPSQWPEGMEVYVKVGLGSGSKDQRIMYRQMIGQVQATLKMGNSPIVTDDNLYNNAVGLCRDAGLQPNDLFTEPPKDEQGNPIPQQQPPDPKVMALQAQVQQKQLQIELQQQSDQAKIQAMIQKHASDAQIEQAKAEMESQLAIRQQDLETFLQQQQMVIDAHKHAATLDNQARIAKMRPGGSLAK